MGLPPAIPLFWVVALVVNLMLVFAMVPSLGARGAALASTLSYLLIFTLVLLYFRKTTGQRLSAILVLRRQEFTRLFGPATGTGNTGMAR
jgi:Na+-driven multidrug efflux pump